MRHGVGGDDLQGGAAAAAPRPALSKPAMAALGFAMLATFYLGVLPTRVLDYALQSIQTIF